MDQLVRHEIYIPKEAAVKRIDLQSLPRSVLTRMGLSLSNCDASRKLTESPEGIWICPAFLRPKGQKLAPNTRNSLLENMSSKLAKEFRAPPGSIEMSFVSSNRAAHKLLEDTIGGGHVSEHISSTSDLPPGSAPQSYKIAVIIYQGRIYLSIRRPSESQCQEETQDAPVASGPVTPSESDKSSSSQRKRTVPEAPPQAAGKKPQKKRVRIPLPPGSLRLMQSLPKKTTAVDKELINGSRPEGIQTQSKETLSGNDTMSQTSSLIPKPSDRAHRVDVQCQSHVGAEQTPEEAASRRSPGLSAAGKGEAAKTNQTKMMHMNPQTESRDQSWTRRESQSSSLQQQPCDFEELEQDEKIAQIKAKLRLKKAALNKLTKLLSLEGSQLHKPSSL